MNFEVVYFHQLPERVFFMANPIEARDRKPALERIPHDAVQTVLTAVEELPPEDVEIRKEYLNLIALDRDSLQGGYRYNLIYEENEDGVGYFVMRLDPSEDMGAFRSSEEELVKSRAKVYDGILARTGYLQIDADMVTERRPTSDHFGSSFVVEDTLRLHFPNHEISVNHSEE